MQGRFGFILFTVAVITFAGCERAEEVDPPPPTPTTQSAETGASETQVRSAAASPVQAANEFLQALESGDVETAAQLVADESYYLGAAEPAPRVDQQALQRELGQAAQAITSPNAFDVLD